ncbi:MAG TPA: hypothetical protein VGC08_04700, partial [Pedobacter sp.]
MLKQTIAEFYQENAVKPASDLKNEIAHFDVVDMNSGKDGEMISLPFSRRTYYTLTLLHGDYSLDFQDETFEVSGDTLLFTTPKIPFGIKAKDKHQKGAFCLF